MKFATKKDTGVISTTTNIDGEHKAKCPGNRRNTCKKLGESHEKPVRKLIHIRDHTAYHLPVGVTVDVFKRQDLNFLKRFVSDIAHDLIGHFVVAYIHQPLCQSGNQCAHSDTDHHLNRAGDIHMPWAYDMVHRLPRQLGNIKRKRHGNCRKKNGKHRKDTVSPEIAEYFF